MEELESRIPRPFNIKTHRGYQERTEGLGRKAFERQDTQGYRTCRSPEARCQHSPWWTRAKHCRERYLCQAGQAEDGGRRARWRMHPFLLVSERLNTSADTVLLNIRRDLVCINSPFLQCAFRSTLPGSQSSHKGIPGAIAVGGVQSFECPASETTPQVRRIRSITNHHVAIAR